MLKKLDVNSKKCTRHSSDTTIEQQMRSPCSIFQLKFPCLALDNIMQYNLTYAHTHTHTCLHVYVCIYIIRFGWPVIGKH